MKQRIGRKILAVSLSLMMTAALYPVSVKAESEYTYTMKEDGTVAITGYTGAGAKLDIPEEIDGKKVTEIADEAFQFNRSIKEADLPDTLTNIGEAAFNDCTQLKTVDIPESVTTIEKNAFFSCTRLENVELPDNLKTLGDGAFYRCNSIEEVTIPGSVEDIGDYTFGACAGLKEAVIEEGVDEIPQQTFYENMALENVVIPDSVKKIGMRAFAECQKLTEIDLPDQLDSIGFAAFKYDPISEFTVNAKCLEDGAFNMAWPESITLGPDVKEIGKDALADTEIYLDPENPYYTQSDDGVIYTEDGTTLVRCPKATKSGETTYQIPDGVEKIADGAFKRNENLTEIVLPDSVTEIGEEAFASCYGLSKINIPSGVKELKSATFEYDSGLSEVTLNEGLEKIGDSTFSQCGSLTEISIPSSVSELNGSAFYRTFSSDGEEFSYEENEQEEMEENDQSEKPEEEIAEEQEKIDSYTSDKAELQIEIDEDNAAFSIGEDGNIYSKDGSQLLAYINRKGESSLDISDSVTSIGKYAVLSTTIKEFTIPSSVTTIEADSIGGYINYSGTTELVNGVRIYGQEDSEAENYAIKNQIAFYTGEPKANAEEVTLSSGETFRYQIANAPDKALAYASSDNQIASVSTDGTITAKANGTADIFAVNGSDRQKIQVTVQGGKDPEDLYAKYREFTSEAELEEWEESYRDYNKDALTENPETGKYEMLKEDNGNINDYSSNNYGAIKAHLVGGKYIKESDLMFGKGGYEQFKTVAEDMHEEIHKFKLNENLKVYSGTSDISFITGGGSSIAEMVASIGKTVTYPGVISTSLAHEIASGHGNYMLEIYAPKDLTDGAYIKDISDYTFEYELLLNYGLTYKVIDAGVRNVTVSSFPDHQFGEETTENYIKLLLNPQSENPDTPEGPDTPENPDTSENPDMTKPADNSKPAATSKKTDTLKKIDAQTQKSKPKKSKASKTADTANVQLEIAVMVAAGAIVTFEIIRRKKRNKEQKG